MTTNETSGPSGTQPNRFLEDISADELSANAPANETSDDRTPDVSVTGGATNGVGVSVSVTEALNQVESRVHTTPEQCLMSITTIAR
jgi:hypothetical protein